MSKSLSLALVFLGAASALGQDPPKPAASPLVLTAALDRDKYVLSDEMQIEVRLENTGDKDVEVNELAYEERSLSFQVKAEWAGVATPKDYVLSVKRPDPHVQFRLAPSRVTLGPKKSVNFLRRFPTIGPGRFAITARYDSGSEVVIAKAVEATVNPSDAGTKLAAVVATANHGAFAIELGAQDSPANVTNFVELVRRGFYNDLTFFRVIPKNWIQTGCPYGIGFGGPGYAVPAEPSETAQHDIGTVSMAGYEKSGHHGSQFFISLARLPALDKKFTVIGRVPPDQMDPVTAIGRVDVDRNTDRPRADVKITTVTITVK